MKSKFFALSLLITSTVSAEIYKCSVDGVTVYQESPCQKGKSNPIDLKVAPPSISNLKTNDAASDTAAKQIADSGKLKNEADNAVRKRILDDYIARARDKLRLINVEMERELATLKDTKGARGNALVSATKDNAISGEMQAVTMKYANKLALQKAEIERLEHEKEAIGKN